MNTGKDNIILMGGDVCGYWQIDFFRSMACYSLTMNNCGKLREGSNWGSDWIFPQFQSIKYNSVSFTINKILQVCVVIVGVFKSSDAVGTSICRGSEVDMVLNPTLGVLSAITLGGSNLLGENRIILYLDFF